MQGRLSIQRSAAPNLPFPLEYPRVRNTFAGASPDTLRLYDIRDQHGRLYSAFNKAHVVDALASASVLLDEEVTSASSGKKIHRIVARKGPGAS